MSTIETHVAALVFLEHPTREQLRERYEGNQTAVSKTMKALDSLLRKKKVVEKRGRLHLNVCQHCRGTGYAKKTRKS